MRTIKVLGQNNRKENTSLLLIARSCHPFDVVLMFPKWLLMRSLDETWKEAVGSSPVSPNYFDSIRDFPENNIRYGKWSFDSIPFGINLRFSQFLYPFLILKESIRVSFGRLCRYLLGRANFWLRLCNCNRGMMWDLYIEHLWSCCGHLIFYW